jgi:hypothetical protein
MLLSVNVGRDCDSGPLQQRTTDIILLVFRLNDSTVWQGLEGMKTYALCIRNASQIEVPNNSISSSVFVHGFIERGVLTVWHMARMCNDRELFQA